MSFLLTSKPFSPMASIDWNLPPSVPVSIVLDRSSFGASAANSQNFWPLSPPFPEIRRSALSLHSLCLHFASSHLFAPNGFLPSFRSKGSLPESYRPSSVLTATLRIYLAVFCRNMYASLAVIRGGLEISIFARSQRNRGLASVP